jgi:hypothetical protein
MNESITVKYRKTKDKRVHRSFSVGGGKKIKDIPIAIGSHKTKVKQVKILPFAFRLSTFRFLVINR